MHVRPLISGTTAYISAVPSTGRKPLADSRLKDDSFLPVPNKYGCPLTACERYKSLPTSESVSAVNEMILDTMAPRWVEANAWFQGPMHFAHEVPHATDPLHWELDVFIGGWLRIRFVAKLRLFFCCPEGSRPRIASCWHLSFYLQYSCSTSPKCRGNRQWLGCRLIKYALNIYLIITICMGFKGPNSAKPTQYYTKIDKIEKKIACSRVLPAQIIVWNYLQHQQRRLRAGTFFNFPHTPSDLWQLSTTPSTRRSILALYWLWHRFMLALRCVPHLLKLIYIQKPECCLYE